MNEYQTVKSKLLEALAIDSEVFDGLDCNQNIDDMITAQDFVGYSPTAEFVRNVLDDIEHIESIQTNLAMIYGKPVGPSSDWESTAYQVASNTVLIYQDVFELWSFVVSHINDDGDRCYDDYDYGVVWSGTLDKAALILAELEICAWSVEDAPVGAAKDLAVGNRAALARS